LRFIATQTIHKYIFSEIWPAFLASLAVFIFIVLAARMLQLLEWIITYGASPLDVGIIVLSLLPGAILFALPATILMAVLVAYLRLSGDNEIVALKTSGFSFYQMVPPALFVSCIALFAALLISLGAAPWGTRTFKQFLFDLAYSKADIGIKERVFSEPFQGITFYINSFSPKDRQMEDIFLVDRRDPAMTNTITAKSGRILIHPKSRVVTVHFEDGSIFTTDKKLESARTVKFSTYKLTIDASDLMASASSRVKGRKEMGIQEILQRLKRKPEAGTDNNEIAVELMERFSIPIAVFLMGLIGVPLGAQIKSGGRLVGVVVSLLIFLLYYLSLVGMRNIGETGKLSPFVAPWIPVLFLAAIGVFLMRRASRDESIHFLSRIVAVREG
jgi:lipopolysaccharide export system permease protein